MFTYMFIYVGTPQWPTGVPWGPMGSHRGPTGLMGPHGAPWASMGPREAPMRPHGWHLQV